MLNGLNVHYICSVSHITVSRILELCFACCITQRQSDGSSKDDPAQKLLLWRLLLRQLLQVRPGGQHSQANSQERRYLVDYFYGPLILLMLTALLNIRPQPAADDLDHRAAVHHRVRRGEVSRQVGTRGVRATEKSSS